MNTFHLPKHRIKITGLCKSALLLVTASAINFNAFTQNTLPSTGNVGIGTSSPAYPLDVYGSARFNGNVYVSPQADQYITANGGPGNMDFVNGSGGGFFCRWIQNGSTPMTLSYANNLLIGTTTDGGYKLAVNGNALVQQGLYLGSASTSQPFITLNSQNSTKFSMSSGGSSDNSFYIYANGGSIGNNYAQIGNNNVGIYFDTRTGIAPYRFISGTTTDWMDIFSTGNVGIGTNNSDPGYKLAVMGSLKATSFNLPTGAGAGLVLTSDASGNATWQAAGAGSSGWAFGGNTVGVVKTLGTIDNNDFPLITNNLERMRITAGGNVLIGQSTQTNSSYILDVSGNVRANRIVVNTTGADFVFDPDYHLPSLKQVDTYVHTFHHLPDIASAAEMQKEGIDLEKNQTSLLQKIEELTLYAIQQDKTIGEYDQKLKQQDQQIKSLQASVARMEQMIEQLGKKEK